MGDPNSRRRRQLVYSVPTAIAQDPNRPQLVYSVPTAIVSANPNSNPNSTRELTRAVIGVVDHYLPYDTHNLYDVTFHTHTIHTLLTSSPSLVDDWVYETLRLNLHYRHNRHRNNLLVGLDVEWRPNTHKNSQNPVATVQLCVGTRCLVFQILHSPCAPRLLVEFLNDANNTFLGVGIEEDIEKLLEDYDLGVAKFVDLRGLAESALGEREMRKAGLKTLAARVLGLEMEKPKWITRSRWDNAWLNSRQVQYACVDAFVSFEVGRLLLGSD